jgi:hypothetical protein
MDTTDYDPQLLTLRVIGRGLSGQERSHWEAARYNAWASLRGRDPARAREWLSTLRVCVGGLDDEHMPQRLLALGAIETIEAKLLVAERAAE